MFGRSPEVNRMSKFFVECRFYKSVVFTVISVIKMDAVAVLVSDRLKEERVQMKTSDLADR